MPILERFNDIIRANVNAQVDATEDPAGAVDRLLRDMLEDLAEVRRGLAGVMAEEARLKKIADENAAEAARFAGYAKKALAAGNEGDARVFVAKKLAIEREGRDAAGAYATVHDTAEKMRRMHDKLASDIETLESRRAAVQARAAAVQTRQALNRAAAQMGGSQGLNSKLDRMEEAAGRAMDEAEAVAELTSPPGGSVDDELARLRSELGR